MLTPSYLERTPAVKEQIVEMSLNGSGIRDISRILQVSTRTVIGELKKNMRLKQSMNRYYSRLKLGNCASRLFQLGLEQRAKSRKVAR